MICEAEKVRHVRSHALGVLMCLIRGCQRPRVIGVNAMTSILLPSVGIVGIPEYIILLSPILKSEGFLLKAVWCKKTDIAKQLAEKFSIAHCPSSFQDLLLLHDVDLVYVVTEPVMQAEVAVKALTSGKHCVCLKPPSISAGEVEKMLVLSQYYSQLRSVLECSMRFVPCFVKLKEILQSGLVGTLWTVDVHLHMGSLISDDMYSWKCDPSIGGGALNILGSHIIDVICHLDSSPCQVKRVNCMLKTFQSTTKNIYGFRSIESDDYCSLQMECTNNMCANVLINTQCGSHYDYGFSVTGSRGRLSIRGLDLYLQQKDSVEKLIHKEDVAGDKGFATVMNLPYEFYYSMVLGSTGMIKALKELFSSTNINNRQTLASFQDGHHLRTVLDCAHRSSRLAQWIDVPASIPIETSVNPFWTSPGVKLDMDKHSPKSIQPVSYV